MCTPAAPQADPRARCTHMGECLLSKATHTLGCPHMTQCDSTRLLLCCCCCCTNVAGGAQSGKIAGQQQSQQCPFQKCRHIAELHCMTLVTMCVCCTCCVVLCAHRSLAAQVQCLVSAWQWSASDTIVHALPLHHVHGIINALYCAHAVGACVNFLPKFSPAAMWQQLMVGWGSALNIGAGGNGDAQCICAPDTCFTSTPDYAWQPAS